MTNIFKTAEKVERKDRLFEIGVETLESQGWTVERSPGLGKASVRRIRKGDVNHLVSIRTTQDQWIAFPPKEGGKGWITLDDVEAVIAVSVDDRESPRFARVHWLPGDEMRERFNEAREARKDAGHHVPKRRRGIWISLYNDDDEKTVRWVGGGAGNAHPPIAEVPLALGDASRPKDGSQRARPVSSNGNDGHLTIAEAKRRLALTFGVPESAIRISVQA